MNEFQWELKIDVCGMMDNIEEHLNNNFVLKMKLVKSFYGIRQKFLQYALLEPIIIASIL